MTSAVGFAHARGPEVPAIQQIPLTERKAGQVRTRWRAIRLNFIATCPLFQSHRPRLQLAIRRRFPLVEAGGVDPVPERHSTIGGALLSV